MLQKTSKFHTSKHPLERNVDHCLVSYSIGKYLDIFKMYTYDVFLIVQCILNFNTKLHFVFFESITICIYIILLFIHKKKQFSHLSFFFSQNLQPLILFLSILQYLYTGTILFTHIFQRTLSNF